MSKRVRIDKPSPMEAEVRKNGWKQVADMGDAFLYTRPAKELGTAYDKKGNAILDEKGQVTKVLKPNPKSWHGFRGGREQDPHRGIEYALVSKPVYEVVED